MVGVGVIEGVGVSVGTLVAVGVGVLVGVLVAVGVRLAFGSGADRTCGCCASAGSIPNHIPTPTTNAKMGKSAFAESNRRCVNPS